MSKGNIGRNLLIILSIIISLSIYPSPLKAQEDVSDIRQIFHEKHGEFDISISIQPFIPVVGTSHIIVTIHDNKNGQPIDSAKIIMTASHDEEESIQIQAVNKPDTPENYHANITVMESGTWTFLIEIQKSGLDTVSLEIPVLFGEPPLPSNQAGSLLWIIVFLSLIGGILFLWNRSRNISRTESIVYRK